VKVACPVLRGLVAGNGLRLLDIDVVAGIVIALIIAKAGLDVVREVSFTLLDASVLDTDLLCEIALEIGGLRTATISGPGVQLITSMWTCTCTSGKICT